MKDKVLDFLENRQPKLCALATATKDGKPECAVVGYAVRNDLTILISTHPTTRKWQNIKASSHVALVFGWTFIELNVQIEGTAECVERNHEEYAQIDAFFFTQNPDAAAFKTPDTVFIKVKPRWVRTLEPNVMPPKTEEMQL